MTIGLRKCKFHSLEILLLSEQLKWNCRFSELILAKGPGGLKRGQKGPKLSQDWVPHFHHAYNNLLS